MSPLPSTAIYVPGRRGRHTNGNGVYSDVITSYITYGGLQSCYIAKIVILPKLLVRVCPGLDCKSQYIRAYEIEKNWSFVECT